MARQTPVKVGTKAWVKPVCGTAAMIRGFPETVCIAPLTNSGPLPGRPADAKRRRLVADLEAALDTLKARIRSKGHKMTNADLEWLTGFLDGHSETLTNSKIRRNWN